MTSNRSKTYPPFKKKKTSTVSISFAILKNPFFVLNCMFKCSKYFWSSSPVFTFETKTGVCWEKCSASWAASSIQGSNLLIFDLSWYHEPFYSIKRPLSYLGCFDELILSTWSMLVGISFNLSKRLTSRVVFHGLRCVYFLLL